MKTLIVEDDFTSRLILQDALSEYGDCHIAVNGREAVDAFRFALESGRGYDLACMDIMMPTMNGREAVKQIRAIEKRRGVLSTGGVKIIMITGLNDTAEAARCFEELCDAYIVKPINLSELQKQLRSCGLIQPVKA